MCSIGKERLLHDTPRAWDNKGRRDDAKKREVFIPYENAGLLWGDLRNRLDFLLRGIFRWRRPGKPVPNALDLDLAREVRLFLQSFDWDGGPLPSGNELRVADIGAKNFFLAAELDGMLRGRGWTPEIHGIEIDAFRRYRNGWMRRDYGNFYAARIARGHYHAGDFLQWDQPIDLALMLHPFVTREPLVRWGLPLSHFRPEALFAHAARLLRARGGRLLVSSPTEEELQQSLSLARAAGFHLQQRRDWFPQASSRQKRPRLGALFSLESAS